MTGLRRESKGGVVTRTLNLTIPEEFYTACVNVAVREGIPVSRVLRVAMQMGVGRVVGEYAKMDRGEDCKVEKLKEMYDKDGRITRGPELRKLRRSKKIVREGDGKHWHYVDDE